MLHKRLHRKATWFNNYMEAEPEMVQAAIHGKTFAAAYKDLQALGLTYRRAHMLADWRMIKDILAAMKAKQERRHAHTKI